VTSFAAEYEREFVELMKQNGADKSRKVDTTGVLAGKMIMQVSTGAYHTCALDTDGRAYCWGHNSGGILGNNSTVDSPVPVEVDMTGVLHGKKLVQIASASNSTCAFDVDGQVYCWGVGPYGNGPWAPHSLVPVCTHGFLDGTGSALPGGCGLNYKVTFDINGESAECTNVKVASDGKSLTCTTSAHPAGWVDVTINDGISVKTLTDGYEYVEDYEGDDDDDDGDDDDDKDKPGTPGGTLIDKLLAPDTGVGKALGWIVLGEVAFVAAGIAVFFRLKKA